MQTGMIKYGLAKNNRHIYQTGNLIHLTKYARLANHLGQYDCELQCGYAQMFMNDPKKLSCLSTITSLLYIILSDSEPHTHLFEQTHALFKIILPSQDLSWCAEYIHYETLVLQEMGFGLDLSTCVSNGTTHNLTYVSPKSGKAVSQEAGLPYHDKLLPMPAFFTKTQWETSDLLPALNLTGYFLSKYLRNNWNKDIPEIRQFFISLLHKEI